MTPPTRARGLLRRPLGGGHATVDWLVVGLGNPGREYAGTRHNVGFMVAEELSSRWDLGKAKDRFRGRLAEGTVRLRPAAIGAASAAGAPDLGLPDGRGGAPIAESAPDAPGAPDLGLPAAHAQGQADKVKVALLCPQTYMNDAGRSVGPARGSYRLPLDRVLVVHDEIDLPFKDIRTRLGGGLAGHNGLKSLRRELGSADFMRVRVGVGRPDTTDSEIVSAHVLGRFSEPPEQVRALVLEACEHVERALAGGGPAARR